ncbi:MULTISPECIES: hypothetical protein [unclassified Xanthobacter]|uniref:hypothetical protein n=1 Tax=unclassified Xanthobacter TaxID=2623496 RepID=UPI001EDF2B7E|nr:MULTISPECIES: hypothetical protein [unclassified Xanthobacter]
MSAQMEYLICHTAKGTPEGVVYFTGTLQMTSVEGPAGLIRVAMTDPGYFRADAWVGEEFLAEVLADALTRQSPAAGLPHAPVWRALPAEIHLRPQPAERVDLSNYCYGVAGSAVPQVYHVRGVEMDRWLADWGEVQAAFAAAGHSASITPITLPASAEDFVEILGVITKAGHDRCMRLQAAMQWLLDSMHDAGETHDPQTRAIYDSVEDAAAALVEAGGHLNWYSPADARGYRLREAAEGLAKAATPGATSSVANMGECMSAKTGGVSTKAPKEPTGGPYLWDEGEVVRALASEGERSSASRLGKAVVDRIRLEVCGLSSCPHGGQ